MNKLSPAKRVQILSCLVEGNSLRSTNRMANVSINTVTKLLIDIGIACCDFQDKALRNLPCKHIQVDEIWAFCYAKQKNVAEAKEAVEGAGDIWTWTAICADTKLVPSWLVGNRDAKTAQAFIQDLSGRLKNKIQLTSDDHKTYLEAVENVFGVVSDDPDANKISTSYVERQNLTMRMGMHHFTRLTNAFSKKAENHAHAVALHFMYYNFARIHKTLRVTPAMEAGITDRVWTLEEIAALADKNSN